MKHKKKVFAILLAAVLLLALFAGCENVSPEGKYYIKSIGGQTIEDYIAQLLEKDGMTLDDVLKAYGIGSIGEYSTIEFKSDGTVVREYAGNEELNQQLLKLGLTWEKKGSRIIIKHQDGTTQEAALKGSEITLKSNDIEYVFVKK